MLTQYCVIGTHYGAYEHGIAPYLLKGGTIATADRFYEAAYALCETFAV
jgi:hypothetical protein